MSSLFAAEPPLAHAGAPLFFLGMALLIIGYYTYGRLVERILAPDQRKTPGLLVNDGVDFVILPHWKNMLIQLLNIAGVGPVIGVILGIKFGPIVFLAIPLGNVFGGAVHDFVGGMMSLRNNGANLPELIKRTLGRTYYAIFSLFMMFLLLLVVAVFINVPAKLLDGFMPELPLFWVFVGAIFLYYIVATLFPIDTIIGKIYPLFGLMLLFGTGAILASMLWFGVKSPADFLVETEAFHANILDQPVIPCLFVTIACGIMSGFHATQSPIVARTMQTERQARSTFYGMMILEGVIAMVWAAAGFAIYNLFPNEMQTDATTVLRQITDHFLGKQVGAATIIAVVILAITSGDTAMRSLRLTLAEMLHLPQKPIQNRLALCCPIILIVAVLLWWSNQGPKAFAALWNYFAWGNQVLAASTLAAATAWLLRRRKCPWITLLPGAFMTFVVVSYILWTSKAHGGPTGLGLELNLAYFIALLATILLFCVVWYRGKTGDAIEEEIPDQAQTPSDDQKNAS
ncbi:MAG: carbon starvation CstA family protein [Planctomycetia bacterium]|nr:carbon starvation CstA family protein [Planctomycetia bacterium]